ncbi:hypothetical protein EW026_g2154 [Hermanssonia centrifuga]|uniref:Beta-xylanase n=1 Tax=Hermanssonia centrifuga TaxID=98765 RepID=A0A4S4KP72_9APHY|nr:hypothetical protein EW026_g2154 [Hermanssonia centrifuga]
MKFAATFAALAALVPFAVAQSAVWGQCGGIGWTGPTTCVSGTTSAPSSVPPSHSSVPTSSAPTSTASAPGSTSTALHARAKAGGKLYFGTATDNPELTNTAYTAILDDNTMFGQLTPANSMKWDAIEPEQGTFTFTQGDAIANLAKTNGQLLRGHNCVWYNQLPNWVSSGSWTTATLTSVIQNHCSTLLYVVKKPFNDDGTWRSDVFYNTLGTSYVGIGLNAARAADPNAKLYINEYNVEYPGAKSTALQNLVKSLQAAGTPIDGVGLQSHWIVGELPSLETLVQNMEAFTALGIEVAITELDIRMTLPSTAALLAQQETDYNTVISSCMAVAGCVGVTIWDFTDEYSWVPSTFSGQGAACPWDQNLARKPAYTGIQTAFTP